MIDNTCSRLQYHHRLIWDKISVVLGRCTITIVKPIQNPTSGEDKARFCAVSRLVCSMRASRFLPCLSKGTSTYLQRRIILRDCKHTVLVCARTPTHRDCSTVAPPNSTQTSIPRQLERTLSTLAHENVVEALHSAVQSFQQAMQAGGPALQKQVITTFVRYVCKTHKPSIAIAVVRRICGLSQAKGLVFTAAESDLLSKLPVHAEFLDYSCVHPLFDTFAAIPKAKEGNISGKTVNAQLSSELITAQTASLLRAATKKLELGAYESGKWQPKPPPTAVFNAVLRVFTVHGIPKTMQTLNWGYRKFPAGAGEVPQPGVSSLYTSIFSLPNNQTNTFSAMKRTNLGPIGTAAANASKAALGLTSAPAAGTTVLSETSHLWQCRGGLWTENRHNPLKNLLNTHTNEDKITGSSDSVGALFSATALQGISGVSAPSLEPRESQTADSRVHPIAHLQRLQRIFAHNTQHHSAKMTAMPIDYHPAVDVVAHKPHAGPALRLLQCVWREMTARLILTNGIITPQQADIVHSKPNAETVRLMLQLCANAEDLCAVLAMAESDGVHLTGPLLSLLSQQSVRFGAPYTALAHLQKVILRLNSAAEEAEQAKQQGKAVAPGGSKEAASDPLAFPAVHPAAVHSGAAASVADAMNTIVQSLAACSANVQAVSAYYALEMSGLPIKWQTVDAVLHAAVEAELVVDAAAIIRQLLTSQSSPPTLLGPTALSPDWVKDVDSAAAHTAIKRALESASVAEPADAPEPDDLDSVQVWAKVFGYPASLRADAIRAAADLGLGAVVLQQWNDIAQLCRERNVRLHHGIANAFVYGFAVVGDLEAAVLAAHAAAVMGASINTSTILPILKAAQSYHDVHHVFDAIHLLQLSGSLSDADRTVLELVRMAERIALKTNPVVPKDSLAEKMQAALHSSPAQRGHRSGPPSLSAGNPAETSQQIVPQFAAGGALHSQLSIFEDAMASYTSFADKSLVTEVKNTLSTHDGAQIETPEDAVRGVLVAISRWLLQHVGAHSAGIGSTPIFSADSSRESDDRDHQIEAAKEMFLLTMKEWPVLERVPMDAYSSAAGSRRRGSQLKDILRGREHTLQYHSFADMIRNSGSWSQVAAQLPKFTPRKAGLVTNLRGQFLPKHMFGPAKFHLQWNVDEDGTGFGARDSPFVRRKPVRNYDFHHDAPLASPQLPSLATVPKAVTSSSMEVYHSMPDADDANDSASSDELADLEDAAVVAVKNATKAALAAYQQPGRAAPTATHSTKPVQLTQAIRTVKKLLQVNK